MHLTALVDHPTHVCCRYRLAALAPRLAAAGYHLDCQPRSTALRSPTPLLIVQRRLLSWWEHWQTRKSRLIFDFDDAVWLRDSYSASGLHSARRLRLFSAVVRRCVAVAAGNRFLAEQASRFIPQSRVYIIPTCVDPDRYPLAAHVPGERPLRLVWIGSGSTLQGLERIRPILESVGAAGNVILKLICDRFLRFAHLPTEPCPWNEAAEGPDLAAADVGIAWMPDDDWSRGKCGLKVLQYMAAGLPVIANPVGVHREMVRHGETGFLVESAADWIDAVRLLADPVTRGRMGAAGRLRVEQDYSVAAGAARWLTLLNSLRGEREAA